jgi:hypothetical protein
MSLDPNRDQRTGYPHHAPVNAKLQCAFSLEHSGPADGGTYLHARQEPCLGPKRNSLAADIDDRTEADTRDVIGCDRKSHR